MGDKSVGYYKHYVEVIAQTFSPCGSLLLCGNNFGDIAIYNMSDSLHASTDLPKKSPEHLFLVPSCDGINCMISTEQFCIMGASGTIYGYDWESIKSYKPSVKWEITLPESLGKERNMEVYSLCTTDDGGSNLIYAACKNGLIYVFGLEDGKHVRTFKGHTKEVHSISQSGSQMASSSSDGSVKLWDLRQNSMVTQIEPASEENLARPDLGNWVGDVDLDSTTLLCGGGHRAGLWDLKKMELVHDFHDTNDAGIFLTKIVANSVLIGGNSEYFYRFHFDGQVLSKLTPSANIIYSIAHKDSPVEVLCLGGASPNIDVIRDFEHRFQVLDFYNESQD